MIQGALVGSMDHLCTQKRQEIKPVPVLLRVDTVSLKYNMYMHTALYDYVLKKLLVVAPLIKLRMDLHNDDGDLCKILSSVREKIVKIVMMGKPARQVQVSL